MQPSDLHLARFPHAERALRAGLSLAFIEASLLVPLATLVFHGSVWTGLDCSEWTHLVGLPAYILTCTLVSNLQGVWTSGRRARSQTRLILGDNVQVQQEAGAPVERVGAGSLVVQTIDGPELELGSGSRHPLHGTTLARLQSAMPDLGIRLASRFERIQPWGTPLRVLCWFMGPLLGAAIAPGPHPAAYTLAWLLAPLLALMLRPARIGPIGIHYIHPHRATAEAQLYSDRDKATLHLSPLATSAPSSLQLGEATAAVVGSGMMVAVLAASAPVAACMTTGMLLGAIWFTARSQPDSTQWKLELRASAATLVTPRQRLTIPAAELRLSAVALPRGSLLSLTDALGIVVDADPKPLAELLAQVTPMYDGRGDTIERAAMLSALGIVRSPT